MYFMLANFPRASYATTKGHLKCCAYENKLHCRTRDQGDITGVPEGAHCLTVDDDGEDGEDDKDDDDDGGRSGDDDCEGPRGSFMCSRINRSVESNAAPGRNDE